MNRPVWQHAAGIIALAVVALSPGMAQAQELIPMPLDAVADARSLQGQTLTLRARVVELLGQQAFVVEAHGGERLLVLAAPDPAARAGHWTGPWARDWQVADEVAITAAVDAFSLADYERQYNVNLDDAEYAAWQGR